MYRDAAPNLDPPDEIVWAGTMKTGEVMHIPRGYWHQATRQERGDGYSLHVTFGLTKRTGVHWLSWLADQAWQHELLRRDIDRWGTAEEQHAQHLAFTETAMRLLTNEFVTDHLDVREQQQAPARHISTRGVFGPPSEVVCLTAFPPAISANFDVGLVTLRAAARELQFKASALPALLPLLSGRPVVVDKISADTGLDAMVLAEVLVAEGICGEVTPELAVGYRGRRPRFDDGDTMCRSR